MLIIDGTQYSNWDRTIFEEMHRGGVTAVHATLVYHASARETLSIIGQWHRHFEQHTDLIMPAHSTADILNAQAQNKVGILFGFQNPSPIEDDLNLVEVFFQLGVRFMQLTYNNQSLLATGCYEDADTGLTRFGKEVIQEMNRLGMVVDLSHTAERSSLEAIEFSEKPVTISHANPSSWHPALRNKSDRLIKALAERDGMLGFSLYPFHLKGKSDATLTDFCAMIARTAEQIGVEHLGIGSDLCQNQPLSILQWMRVGRWKKEMDYGEGSAQDAGWPDQPSWFENNSHFPNLIQGLLEVGFDRTEVEQIMGQNWLRFMRNAFG